MLEDDHMAVLVKSLVVLSLNDPVAVNCCVVPVWIEEPLGLTEIEARVAVEVPPPAEEEELGPPLQPVSAVKKAITIK